MGKSKAEHWSSIFASHTFHEIQMYYPMRVYRDKKFKLNSNRSKKVLASESTSLPPIKERGRMPAKDTKVPPTSKSSDVKQRIAELKGVRLHKEAAKSGAVPTN